MQVSSPRSAVALRGMQDFHLPLTVVSSSGKLTWSEVGEEEAAVVGVTLFSTWLYLSRTGAMLSEGCPF